jgi:hypothetical protein
LFEEGSTYLKISRRISEGIRSKGGYVSKAVIVSGIEICFSTDSLEYRSSRRIQMSSETAFDVGVTCTAIRLCFRFVSANCHRLTFLARDLAAITGRICDGKERQEVKKVEKREARCELQHVQRFQDGCLAWSRDMICTAILSKKHK